LDNASKGISWKSQSERIRRHVLYRAGPA
jgi:hypothetical protein